MVDPRLKTKLKEASELFHASFDDCVPTKIAVAPGRTNLVRDTVTSDEHDRCLNAFLTIIFILVDWRTC